MIKNTVAPMAAVSYRKLDADRQPILTVGGSSTWTRQREAAAARLAAGCRAGGIALELDLS